MNKKSLHAITTHEGGPAKRITAEEALRRSVLTCLLWEDNFYEDGISIADRIKTLVKQVPLSTTAALAEEARTKFKLRHVPLLLLVALIENGYKGKECADAIANTIGRADEIGELLAMYWGKKKKPISNALRKGLAKSLTKFNEYQLAKWDKNNAAISLRDVMFLVHPKPTNKEQEELFKKIADQTLAIPETWETMLSAGKDKKETFTKLINENKLGGLALLRNLRNMRDANVEIDIIKSAILNMNTERILPFRFTAAVDFAPPALYDTLEQKFLEATTKNIDNKLSGSTLILVDVSGSMNSPVSSKADLTSCKAAGTVAAFCREVCETVRILKFDTDVQEVPNKRGFSLIQEFQPHGGTDLGLAVKRANNIGYDRLIVITDEQSRTQVPDPLTKKSYMVNVANHKNGVGYNGNWTHIDGWSEHILTFINEYEKSFS